MKRALRLDKARLAALSAVLRLYLHPDQLRERLPALSLLTRRQDDIAETAARILPAVTAAFPAHAVAIAPCRSQIGSGALPVDLLPSMAVTLAGGGLQSAAASVRRRPVPVLGRVGDRRLWLDCRCLEPAEESRFAANLVSA